MNLRPFGPEIRTYVLVEEEEPTVSSCPGFCIGAFSQGKTYLVAVLLYVIEIEGISLVQDRMGFMQTTAVGIIAAIPPYVPQ